MNNPRTIDPITHMTKWEDGLLEIEEIVGLFQYLIDTGWCWELGGRYREQAQELIDCGLCVQR